MVLVMSEKVSVEKLERGLHQLNISFSNHQIDQLVDYYHMVVEKNKVMNLTAITEFDEFVEKHFLDSLSLSLVLYMSVNLSYVGFRNRSRISWDTFKNFIS